MRTNVCVEGGAPLHVRAGETSAPSHVNFSGIDAPSEKAELVRTSGIVISTQSIPHDPRLLGLMRGRIAFGRAGSLRARDVRDPEIGRAACRGRAEEAG